MHNQAAIVQFLATSFMQHLWAQSSHTVHTKFIATKQYNWVLAKGWWSSAPGKVSMMSFYHALLNVYNASGVENVTTVFKGTTVW